MSTQPEIETVSTGADKAKLAGAALLLVASIVAFYYLGKQDLWVRVVALLALVAAAVGLFFTSESGKQLIAFSRDSVRETKKVVWPTRKEAMQMKTLEWLLYDLILGWRQ
jgi:preprotein translocase subunit SecE